MTIINITRSGWLERHLVNASNDLRQSRTAGRECPNSPQLLAELKRSREKWIAAANVLFKGVKSDAHLL